MNFIELKNDDVFNNGCHKKVYNHPEDPNLCIKIPYNAGGQQDIDRELLVRKKLQKRNIISQILPQYFGTVNTNLGNGYVFELIKDYDNSISMTLEDYLKDEILFKSHYNQLLENILFLKKRLFIENLILMYMSPENMIIQRLSPKESRPVLVNDLGSAALIPLEYYFDYFNKQRTIRRWSRFIDNIASRYSYPQVKKFMEAIK